MPGRILVIDDDSDLRATLVEILGDAGYEVLGAGNGKQAVELCSSGRFDLVITDLFMPEKEGIETIVELTSLLPGAKIFAMSGGGKMAVDLCPIAEKLGAVKTFKKPFHLEQLLGEIASVLGAR